MMTLVYCFALALVSVVCAIGVLHPRYNDNLMERVGMAATCLGGIGEISSTLRGLERLNAASLFVCGVAVFAIGSLWKHRAGQRDRRRVVS